MIVQSRSDLFKSVSPAALAATMPFITILASFMIPLALKVGLAAKVDSITSRLTRADRDRNIASVDLHRVANECRDLMAGDERLPDDFAAGLPGCSKYENLHG